MEELPRESIAILDSSVLFAMGGPSNEKYQTFERYVTRRNVTVRIPDQVAEELGESPAAYTFQRDRLRAAEDAGWLERAEVDVLCTRPPTWGGSEEYHSPSKPPPANTEDHHHEEAS